MKPIYFVDTETTGLSQIRHEIIEIAVCDIEGRELLNRRVKPMHPERCNAAVREINGFNEEAWKDAPDWRFVAPEVLQIFDRKRCYMAGHNTQFDLGFILEECRTKGFVVSTLPYKALDLYTLAVAKLAPRGHTGFRLADICEALEVVNEAPHTALGDVRATAACWRALMEIDAYPDPREKDAFSDKD